jgi:hypothetical protein
LPILTKHVIGSALNVQVKIANEQVWHELWTIGASTILGVKGGSIAQANGQANHEGCKLSHIGWVGI